MLIHMSIPPSFTSVYALKDLDVFNDGLLLTEIEDTQTTLKWNQTPFCALQGFWDEIIDFYSSDLW